MKAGRLALKKILALPGNPKAHDLDTIEHSMDRFGFLERIVINNTTGHMLSGHGRVETLAKQQEDGADPPNGIQASKTDWIAPVDYVDVPEKDEKAAAIALNRLTERGGWDEELLIDALSEFDEADFVGTGYDGADLLELMSDKNGVDKGEPPEPQIDRAEELQWEWGTETGQIWECGRHRVLCGDSTKAEDVGRLVEGAKMNGCFTSPPYAEQRKAQYGGILAKEYVKWWGSVQSHVKDIITEDGSLFINIKPHAEKLDLSLYVLDLVIAHVREWGWHFAEEFCWERSGVPKQVVRRFKNQFEPIYQFTANEWKFRPLNVQVSSANVPIPLGVGQGDTNAARRQGYMGAIQGNKVENGMAYPGNRISAQQMEVFGHPATFPIGLPLFFIRAFSDENDLWYDPFLGSGTTLIACDQIGRTGYGMEIDPAYVAVTLQRFKDMGIKPVLEQP